MFDVAVFHEQSVAQLGVFFHRRDGHDENEIGRPGDVLALLNFRSLRDLFIGGIQKVRFPAVEMNLNDERDGTSSAAGSRTATLAAMISSASTR